MVCGVALWGGGVIIGDVSLVESSLYTEQRGYKDEAMWSGVCGWEGSINPLCHIPMDLHRLSCTRYTPAADRGPLDAVAYPQTCHSGVQ